jgi:typhoid toxin secretion A
MADLFLDYMQPILTKEGRGRLTNNPNDRGGLTIWGVTEKIARAAGYSDPMMSMTIEQALAIFRALFWIQPGFDAIADDYPALGRYMLDLGINGGPAAPSKALQRCLNVLNGRGSLYADLLVDGHCGLITRHCLSAYRAYRADQNGDEVLMAMMRGLAAARYIEIAEGDETQESNEFGWQRNRILG